MTKRLALGNITGEHYDIMHVLLVEDSASLRNSIGTALTQSGYKVDSIENGDDGLAKAQAHEYDAAVLDIMLPGLDGLSILKTLRDEGDETPILLLTAKDTIEDRIAGLQTGADDYLVKPFALQELLARVEALCRRRYRARHDQNLNAGDLELDTVAKRVTRKGSEITLAPREFNLLEYLMTRKGQVVSRQEIERKIYDDMSSPNSNVVDSAVCVLRRKIANYEGAPTLIHTRRGHGYIIEERQG
jgi:DNA-binding response OmpR family regulator